MANDTAFYGEGSENGDDYLDTKSLLMVVIMMLSALSGCVDQGDMIKETPIDDGEVKDDGGTNITDTPEVSPTLQLWSAKAPQGDGELVELRMDVGDSLKWSDIAVTISIGNDAPMNCYADSANADAKCIVVTLQNQGDDSLWEGDEGLLISQVDDTICPSSGKCEIYLTISEVVSDSQSRDVIAFGPIDSAGDGSEIVYKAVIDSDDESFTYVWHLDGEVIAGDNMDQLILTGVESGDHTLKVEVTDSNAITLSHSLAIEIPHINHAPSIVLELPDIAGVNEPVAWSIIIDDIDGDELTHSVIFPDSTSSQELSGNYTFNQSGDYTFIATVSDPLGESASSTKEITVMPNIPPSLSVTVHPITDGMLTVMVDEDVIVSYTTFDSDGDDIVVTYDWGDGSYGTASSPMTHSYDNAGDYSITITAIDEEGNQVEEKITVEVIADIEDAQIYQWFEQQIPEDDAIENEVDTNDDGTLDEAEDAKDEEGYVWEDDFDSDGDGEADHDEGNLDSWQTKDENHVEDIAESNDTSGGARSEDTLTDYETHLYENEGANDWENNNITGAEDVMTDLFSDEEDPMEDAKDDPALDGEHYENELDGINVIWHNETFPADLDEDGTDESNCYRSAALFWIDADGDGEPERAVFYRVKYCTADRDSDGTDDLTFTEVEALNYTDADSSGTPEVVEALHMISVVWINGTMHDKNSWILGAAVEDHDEDGNDERTMVAVAHIREIDLTGDGINEASWIVYGILAVTDVDDDGTPDEGILVLMNAVENDLDGDGNKNHQAHWGQIYHVIDHDQDGAVDDLRAVQFGEEKFDNNSDGITDTRSAAWLGVRIVDFDSDGDADEVMLAQGYEHEDDADGDGNAESFTRYFVASLYKDVNADDNPEHQWALAHATEATDVDDDGSWDYYNESAAGVEAIDVNSDGNVDHYFGLRIHALKTDEHANGWGSEVVAIWIIEAWDVTSDGNINIVHAVILITVHWDNNSDGAWDTEWAQGAIWNAIDFNGDGNAEREVYMITEVAKSDDDADGNIEYHVTKITLHSRNSTSAGDVEHEYYYNLVSSKSNISTSGIAQYENVTLVAYETWNDSSKQETHAIVAVADSWDYDRDGTKESETTHVYHDNRS